MVHWSNVFEPMKAQTLQSYNNFLKEVLPILKVCSFCILVIYQNSITP